MEQDYQSSKNRVVNLFKINIFRLKSHHRRQLAFEINVGCSSKRKKSKIKKKQRRENGECNEIMINQLNNIKN